MAGVMEMKEEVGEKGEGKGRERREVEIEKMKEPKHITNLPTASTRPLP